MREASAYKCKNVGRHLITVALVSFGFVSAHGKAEGARLCDYEDQVNVRIEPHGDTYRLMLDPPKALEATIDVELKLNNMIASTPFRFRYFVDKQHKTYKRPIELTRFSQQVKNTAYTYDWRYHVAMGLTGGRPDYSYVYTLPYERGKHFRCMQGNFGSYSHQKGTSAEYAVDFAMPEGTSVCAARDGVVIVSYDDSTVGGIDKKYIDCANAVMVKHRDGTYGKYVHLKPHSNRVKVGQHVRIGDQLGLAGHTGFADDPHLHFVVTTPLSGSVDKSLPIIFSTDKGNLRELKMGEIY